MVEVDRLLKLTRGKTKVISVKLSPELVGKIDEAIQKDGEIKSRNQLIERCLLKYLESRGEI